MAKITKVESAAGYAMRLIGFALCMAIVPISTAKTQSSKWTLRAEAQYGCHDSTVELSGIESFVVRADGGAVLYSDSDKQMLQFGRDGKLLGRFGRGGKGPGEFEGVIGMALQSNGSLWVVNSGNQRYSVFGPTGKLQLELHRPSTLYDAHWVGGFDEQGFFYDQFFFSAQKSSSLAQGFLRFNSKGALKDTVSLPPKAVQSLARGSTRYPIPYGNTLLLAFARDGSIFYAMSGANEIWRQTRAGVRSMQFRVNVPTRMLSAIEADSVRRYLGVLRQELGIPWSVRDIPSSYPWLQRIAISSDGYVWLMHEGSSNQSTFSVYNSRGENVSIATLNQKLQRNSPLQISGNALWAVVVDDFDVPCLTRFGIAK